MYINTNCIPFTFSGHYDFFLVVAQFHGHGQTFVVGIDQNHCTGEECVGGHCGKHGDRSVLAFHLLVPTRYHSFLVHVSCTLCGIVFGRRMLLCCCCCCCCCFDFLFHGPFCYGILETRTHILSLCFFCSLFFLFSLFSLFPLFSLIPVFSETDYDVVLHLNPQWLHPTLATNSKKKKKSSSHRNHLQIKDAQRYANNKSIFSATHTLVLLCSRVRFVDSWIETKLNCFTFFGVSFFLSKVRQFGVVQRVQRQQRRTKGSVVGGV